MKWRLNKKKNCSPLLYVYNGIPNSNFLRSFLKRSKTHFIHRCEEEGESIASWKLPITSNQNWKSASNFGSTGRKWTVLIITGWEIQCVGKQWGQFSLYKVEPSSLFSTKKISVLYLFPPFLCKLKYNAWTTKRLCYLFLPLSNLLWVQYLA